MPADAAKIAATIGTEDILIEEMITGTIAELLVGVVRDPAHGFVLTLGAGGILTEVLRDTASLLIPADDDSVRAALNRLKIAPVLHGYRGKPAINLDAVIAAIDAVQSYVIANADTIDEVAINPLLCTAHDASAADALIRKA